MRSYIIKIWENEDLREQGISDIIESDIPKLEIAIDKARDIQEKNGYACIEVQDKNERMSYYTNDGIDERIDENAYLNALKQERINYFFNLIYKEQNIVYIDGDLIGKAEDVIMELEKLEKRLLEEYAKDSEDIKKDIKGLKKDILEYDKDDIVKIYEHPMAIIPMLDSEKGTLKDLRENFLSKVEFKAIDDYTIKDVVESYIGYNDILDFMEYGSDRDVYTNPTFTTLYKELLEILDIKYKNIYTEDLSDGKYQTTIQFENEDEIIIDTSAWNNVDVIIDNLKSIMEEVKRQSGKSLINEKGVQTMYKYESIIIMNPTINENEIKKELKNYKEYLENLSNKPVTVDNLGIRGLAYPIRDNKDGYFAIFNFYGKAENISELERKYRIDKNIIKFIVIKQELEQKQEQEDSQNMDDEDMEM